MSFGNRTALALLELADEGGADVISGESPTSAYRQIIGVHVITSHVELIGVVLLVNFALILFDNIPKFNLSHHPHHLPTF